MLSFYLSLLMDEPSRCRFEVLYLEYRQLMFFAANQILHDENLAEDAVHEAFMRILQNFNKFSFLDCNKTRSTFVLIVKNIAIDILRKRMRQTTLSLDDYEELLSSDEPDPEEDWLARETSQEILTAVNRMKPIYADILALSVVCEMKSDEIASLLGLPPSTVRVRLHRGRHQLMELLKGDSQHGL
jgi:RNA polymerase sigma-70 factor, ECF subfamily